MGVPVCIEVDLDAKTLIWGAAVNDIANLAV